VKPNDGTDYELRLQFVVGCVGGLSESARIPVVGSTHAVRSVSNSNVADVSRCRRLCRKTGVLRHRRRRRVRRRQWRWRRAQAARVTHVVVEQLLDAVLTWAQTCLHTITIARHSFTL